MLQYLFIRFKLVNLNSHSDTVSISHNLFLQTFLQIYVNE